MSVWEALIYGIVQGVTEYLPISSSAHLILLPQFMDTQDLGQTFDVFLHLATLLSTLVYFWKDWLGIFKTVPVIGGLTSLERVQPSPVHFRLLVVATIPALLVGGLLQLLPENIFRSPLLIVFTLALGGILLFVVDHFMIRDREFKDIQMKDGLVVGLFQCLALIPGVSRAGATIIGGRFCGLDRAAAARFSFLMSAPVILAAVTFKLRDPSVLFNSEVGVLPLMVAFFSAFISGCLAIGFLLRLLNRFGYFSFAVYRIVLALVVFYVIVI